MKPVLTIDVELDEIYEVNGTAGKASMLLFHGECDCENFKGRILPRAVDTQKEPAGEPRLLSARYILEGKDSSGDNCRIFIENNSVPNSEYTSPVIYTDSSNLKWLESANLYGSITSKEGGVIIKIYCE